MVTDLEGSSFVRYFDDVSPLNVLIWRIFAIVVVYGNAPAAVANGYDMPIRVGGQELVLAVAWQVLGYLEELLVSLSWGVTLLGFVNDDHLSLVVVRLRS